MVHQVSLAIYIYIHTHTNKNNKRLTTFINLVSNPPKINIMFSQMMSIPILSQNLDAKNVDRFLCGRNSYFPNNEANN